MYKSGRCWAFRKVPHARNMHGPARCWSVGCKKETTQKVLCMQENNFEKSVQQKLDELQLTPSEPVWQKVEAAIKKRRERRLVFWLLPTLLLTGGLFWWQLTPQQSENSAQQATHKSAPQVQQTFSNPHAIQSTQATHNLKP